VSFLHVRADSQSINAPALCHPFRRLPAVGRAVRCCSGVSGRVAGPCASPAPHHPAHQPWPARAHRGWPFGAGNAARLRGRVLLRPRRICAGASHARRTVLRQGLEPVLPPGLIGYGSWGPLPVREDGQPVAERRRQGAGCIVVAAPIQPGRQRTLAHLLRGAGRVAACFLHHGDELAHPRQPLRAYSERCLGGSLLVDGPQAGGPQPRPRPDGSRQLRSVRG
jgi:hypothetical protein